MNDTREQTTKRTPPPIITNEDMRKILSVVLGRVGAMCDRKTAAPGDNVAVAVWASFCTGMTTGEVCGLEGGDCSVILGSRYGSIHVCCTMRDSGPRYPKVYEQAGRVRTIATDNTVTEAMRGLARLHRPNRRDKPWPVIARQSDAPRDRWTRPASVSRAFGTLCERVGLGRPYTFASLRRTHAAMLLRAGVPVDVVAARLGIVDAHRMAMGYRAACAEGEARRGEYDARLGRMLTHHDPLWGTGHARDRAAWATFVSATDALMG